MLFNSYVFWAFFLVVLLAYRQLGHRAQNVLLLVSSYLFYGLWDWRFLSLIWISTLVDYWVSRRLGLEEAPGRRKLLLWTSMATNLGILGFFKYWNFFAGELSGLLTTLGLSAIAPTMDIVLPVGISFYTFQTMSYTIDVYRRQVEPVEDLLDFGLFVCFFPQLVAGPIERSARLIPQVTQPRVHQAGDFAEGLYLVLFGLFKKVVVADNMAGVVGAIFAVPASELTGAECLVGVYAFAFQIYGDFSGYSSMAQGIAKWLGFDLSTNFKMPYFACTPSEFWRRWHISLSQWLRDYLYISLGGNRGGPWKTQRNLILTMVLGGLWHGAGWTFLAWGLYHGLLLSAYRPFEGYRPRATEEGLTFKRLVNMVLFFHFTCIGWLLFRAESMTQAWAFLAQSVSDFRVTAFSGFLLSYVAFFALPLMAYEWWVETRGDLIRMCRLPWWTQGAFYSYLILMLLFFTPARNHEFIYFQF